MDKYNQGKIKVKSLFFVSVFENKFTV